MEVTYVSIETIQPYDKNPRKNNDAVPQVARSIESFGWQQPIVVDESRTIIIGHTRYKAARKLQLTEVPIHIASDLNDEQIAALRLADNKTGELADWDKELLSHELRSLNLADFDLTLTGFDEDEISQLLNLTQTEENDPEDDVPTRPARPESNPGTIYQLGKHRLIVGDATNPDDLARLMGKQRATLLITDPPYNVDYVGKGKESLTFKNEKMSSERFVEFLTTAFSNAASHLKPGSPFYIWYGDARSLEFYTALSKSDLGEVKQQLVWQKNTLVMGRNDYHYRHEPCMYGWMPGAKHQWRNDRKQTTLMKATDKWKIRPAGPDRWSITTDGETYIIEGTNINVKRIDTTLIECDRPTKNKEHPTMKPVKLFEYQILNSTRRGAIVLDTFGGSGTTLIACEKQGRKARTIEMDAGYADVIRRRWVKLTTGNEDEWQSQTPEALE